MRFGLELAAMVALGYWGFQAGDSAVVEWLPGLGAPLAFALVWGAFIAPKAPARLQDPARLGLEVILFVAAVVSLAAAGQPLLATILAGAIAVNLVLTHVLGQRRDGGI